MGKKRVPAKATEPKPQQETPIPGSDLSTAVKALHEAAQSLAATATQMAHMMQQMAAQGSGTGNVQGAAAAPSAEPSSPAANAAGAEELSSNGSASKKTEETKRFYERLEQTGQLADVDEKTDLSALPPHVTHIRRPDGSIERLGFSISPYTRK